MLAANGQVALHLCSALEEPFQVEGYPLQVEVSIGAALYPTHGSDPLTLLRRADVAMYNAKRGHDGYALSNLKHLPADELKIDRAFVQHVTTDRTDKAIVRSTVNMAHSLGISVVAEGVEDQAAWDLLETLGCDIVQGYYLSRPVPAQDLERWWTERKAARWLDEQKEAVAL